MSIEINGASPQEFEQHILELIRRASSEEEENHLKNRGEELYIKVLEVELEGIYPETLVRIRRHDRARDVVSWQAHPLWQDPTFFNAQGEPQCSPQRMAGDILIHARGG